MYTHTHVAEKIVVMQRHWVVYHSNQRELKEKRLSRLVAVEARARIMRMYHDQPITVIHVVDKMQEAGLLIDGKLIKKFGLRDTKIVKLSGDDYEKFVEKLEKANLTKAMDNGDMMCDISAFEASGYKLEAPGQSKEQVPSDHTIIIKSGNTIIRENLITLMMCERLSQKIDMATAIGMCSLVGEEVKIADPDSIGENNFTESLEKLSVCELRFLTVYGDLSIDTAKQAQRFMSTFKKNLKAFYKMKQKTKGRLDLTKLNAADVEMLAKLEKCESNVHDSLHLLKCKEGIILLSALVEETLTFKPTNQLVVKEIFSFVQRLVKSFGLDDFVFEQAKHVVLRKAQLKGLLNDLQEVQGSLFSEFTGGEDRPKCYL